MKHSDQGVTPVEGWWLRKDVYEEDLVGNKLTQLVKLQDESPYGVVSGTILGTTVGLDEIVAFNTMKRAYKHYSSVVRNLRREKRLKKMRVLAELIGICPDCNEPSCICAYDGQYDQEPIDDDPAYDDLKSSLFIPAIMFVMVNSLSLMNMWRPV